MVTITESDLAATIPQAVIDAYENATGHGSTVVQDLISSVTQLVRGYIERSETLTEAGVPAEWSHAVIDIVAYRMGIVTGEAEKYKPLNDDALKRIAACYPAENPGAPSTPSTPSAATTAGVFGRAAQDGI